MRIIGLVVDVHKSMDKRIVSILTGQ